MNNALTKLALAILIGFAIGSVGCATQDTSIGTKIGDSVITTKVKAALLADPDVNGQSVSVETVAGVVQLSGFVSSQAMASRAADIARRTDGVISVQNKVSVR